jgi:hypothetical protein
MDIKERLVKNIPALETLPDSLLDLLVNEIDLIIQEEITKLNNERFI